MTAALLVGACIQGSLLTAYWTGGWAQYGRAWAATTPLSFAVSIAMTLEALSAMARHFPKARNLSMVSLAVFGLVSLVVLLPLSVLENSAMWLLNLRSHWKIMAVGILAGARLFLGWVEPAMRENVRLYVAGALLCMGGSATGDIIINATQPNYWGIAAGQFLLLLLPIASYSFWWRMGETGEAYTPTPAPTEEEIAREQARVESQIRAYRDR